MVFSSQQLYSLQARQVVEQRILPLPPTIGSTNKESFMIFKNNAYVMIISFALSLFYGAGALFLITLNASIFASSLAAVIKTSHAQLGFLAVYSFTICNLGILFLHAIPEVIGYLLAAISGGVLSHAFIREKIMSGNFKIVLKDAILLLLIAIFVLLIAAVLENNVSSKLFSADVCTKNKYLAITAWTISIGLIIIFEFLRLRKVFHRKILTSSEKS